MIIELFLLKDKDKKPESMMVELTPETHEEDDSLRNAKILHKNNIIVYWGDTLELHKPLKGTKPNDSKKQNEFIGFSGLKINFNLPKEQKPIEKDKQVEEKPDWKPNENIQM